MGKLQETIQYLKDNLYILAKGKDEFVFSKKFYEDLVKTEPSEELVHIKGKVINIAEHEEMHGRKVDWPYMFMHFIIDAKVPKRIQAGGSIFDANKYSEPAMKEFKRMLIKEQIIYDVLVRSTFLYYTSATDYKKKIGNYILDGDWRTDYTALIEAAQGGVEKLTQHINEQKNGNDHNPWS